ncbi:putative sensor histidine kinase with a CHASE3 and a response regulator receiver domain; peptide signal [Bradyrhizobium sp. ORS 278]|uniref:CHASE3 domain-containing protein n=1 Tax=Bradyrhizobium sp. (strain ORS 278) TaxID=114615 RepID=UPI0001508762|nr:CHASE3 domain-containing protein [Bradyrhizobium sp. ORS 278]CAL77260.1 putative sensor histidine kinase with a CHASE3 and a response regulator receiver domain; peptide signal [Bradyrhizobium sp. ORS 278]
MIRQRLALGLGLGTLLAIGAASAALDVKSRHDEAWVTSSLDILQKTSDLRLLLSEAEASSRGFALTGAAPFRTEFDNVSTKIPSAVADLQRAVADSPMPTKLLGDTAALIVRRIDIAAELIRLRAASDTAGLQALGSRGEGPATMHTITENLDRFVTDQRALLAQRSITSKTTGSLLLTIDLCGLALLLVIAAYLIRHAYLEDRALRSSLVRSEAEAVSLAERAEKQHLDLVEAHEKLRHSAEILQSTFNSMAEGVLVIDAADTVVFSNPAVERLLGYRPGRNLSDVRSHLRVYESDGLTPVAAHDLPTPRALRGESFDRRELIIHQPDHDETLRLMISGRPLRDSAGRITGAAMVYHDITAAHETERLLQQAQKLDAIGKLTGGVAHDFNNMLTIITGTIETLADEVRDRPAAAATAALIGQAADRCTELIRHLLAFARKQPLHPRDSDVNSTILDIAKLLRPTLGEQIEINSILEEETLIAHIDSAQLANSLVNMAINARDAMPNGGKLLLESRRVELDDAYAAANAGVTPGSYIMVAVSDTGTGMSPAVRDRAFEPFFTTKEAGKGSGLGLSMVYGFVKQSGGHIKIYSEEGRGTTIRLYIPAPKGQTATPALPDPPPPRGDETIFIVEDDLLVQDFVVAQLQSLGYKTMTASTGVEALAKIESGQPFDLLFTDVIMPGGVNGKELAEETLRQRPGTKVLYTSGYTDNAMVEHGRIDHASLLLTKPYRKSELAQMVRLALHSSDAPREVASPGRVLAN